jgi:hypothetical protein
MEGRRVRSGVEVQVTYDSVKHVISFPYIFIQTSKYFVAAFATQNHFDAHRFDFSAQEIHRGASSDCRYIVGLKMVDNFGYRV